MKPQIKELFDQDLFNLFYPYSLKLTQNQTLDKMISPLSMKYIKEIRNKKDIFNYVKHFLEDD